MHYFCTYFDHRYMSRGLALYRSLRQHCDSFRIWMLCMDAEAYSALAELDLPGVCPLTLEEFEEGDQILLHAKQNRSLLEYYFTCTPCLPLFVLNRCPDVDRITYLDADLFFYADPSAVFTEMGDCSIAIIGHRFSNRLQHLEVLGTYNVGWISFRRDSYSRECLIWWRERCNEWCYDRSEDGRFADQKYLDDWPTRFQGTLVLLHKGANLAPWNLAKYQIGWHADQLWVDDQPLIFFHFHALRRINQWLYDSNMAHYETTLSPLVRNRIYAPYLQTLLQVELDLKALKHLTGHQSLQRHKTVGQSAKTHSFLRHSLSFLYGARHVVKGLLAHQYLLVPKRRTQKEGSKRKDHSPSHLMGRP
jgi:hypothetical protein